MKTVAPSVIEDLARYDSATVQNAAILVRGHVPAHDDYSGPELKCMAPDFGTLVGYAVTAEATGLHEPAERSDPSAGSGQDWNNYYDAIASAKVPTIGVLKDVDVSTGRAAIMGDGMAYRHRALGCLGVVVDGSARDVEGIRKAGCGLWATSRVPGHGPFNMVRCNSPVLVAGLRVVPGDILVCDADGVTRVPLDIAADVARMCAEVREKEAAMHRYFSAPDFTLEKYAAWKASRG